MNRLPYIDIIILERIYSLIPHRKLQATPYCDRAPISTPPINREITVTSDMFSLILLAVSVFAISAKPCDDGWRYFPGSNSCYKLLQDNITWTLAEFKCLFQGAHHVAIESAEENQFVHELARHGEIWTGAAFFGKNPVYVNSNQEPYGKFTNWPNEVTPPMNRARRCIKMDQAGFWFQSCCKKKTFAVCEKPAAYEMSWDKTTIEQNDFRRAKFFRHV